jgi:hypothetical protein
MFVYKEPFEVARRKLFWFGTGCNEGSGAERRRRSHLEGKQRGGVARRQPAEAAMRVRKCV